MKNLYKRHRASNFTPFTPIERKRKELPLFLLLLPGIFMLSNLFRAELDYVYFTFDTPLEISVCSESQSFGISYLNASTFSLTGQEVTIYLPTGIKYVSGSLQDTSSLGVYEHDISDLQAPVFRLNDLASGASAGFMISYEASIPAMNAILSGGILQNRVELVANEGDKEENSVPYNALYPALSIINISPSNQTVNSGETANRTIKIVNGGNGKLSNFFITDIHAAGIELISTSLGSINPSKDTVFFDGNDFLSIGNGDAFFDTNESLEFVESIAVSGCETRTINSSIHAGWSCETDTVVDATMNANISISLQIPNLSLSTQASQSACYGSDSPNTQEIILKNNGSGKAIDVLLDIWKSTGGNYTQNIYSRIDTSSISYRLNGGFGNKISPVQSWNTNNSGTYAVLGSNPIGRMELALPDMESGDEIIVNWNTFNYCVNVCNNETNTGWKTEVSYNDVCQTGIQSKNKVGENDFRGQMTTFVESPSDLGNGQEGQYLFTISSFKNEFPEGDGAHYEVNFSIPQGLNWSADPADLGFSSGVNSWTPMSVNYDSNSRILTAKYPTPAPFNLPKSEIQLKLTADCSALPQGSNEVQVALDINYVPDTTCAEACSMPFLCTETTSTEIKCPGTCTEGIAFDAYSIKRTSFGLADNNQDGKADSGGSLDMSKVRDKRAMVGDTLKAVFKGKIKSPVANTNWRFGYASSSIEKGINLSPIRAELVVYDYSSSTYISCSQVAISYADQGDSRTFSYDFSPANLESVCGGFSNFEFDEQDSVWLNVEYKVTGNIGGAVEQVDVENDLYISEFANSSVGQRYSCNNWGGRFIFIGYYFINEKANNFTVNACSKVINQDFKLSIGDCCSNFNGGNLFPFEYRYWAHVKKAQLTIPDYYSIKDIYMRHRRTRYTNASSTQTQNSIQIDSVSGNTYFFDLEQYFDGYGGNIFLSDDGFRGTFYVELAPSCDVPENTYQEIDWKFTFQESAFLSGNETEWYESNPDKIRFSPANLQLTTPTPSIDGLQKEISWTVKVKPSGAGVDYSWMHFRIPNGDVTINAVVDQSSGDSLQLNGDIYRIGSISSGQTKTYLVKANYSACAPTSIFVDAGYECTEFPATFADFSCSYSSLTLEVDPEDAQLQMRLSGIRENLNCEIYTDIEVELASVKQGYVNDISLDVQLPAGNSMSLVPGTMQILYPLSGNWTSMNDPALNGNSFEVDVNNEIQEIANEGLVGITNTAKNRIKLAFRVKNEADYKAGDLIRFSTTSYASCGEELPSVSVPYDVNLRITKTNIAGLTDASGNNWSVAWGDYNGDGFEDLFVGEYNHWESSKIYTNNGNGQFTEASNLGSILTDLGSAAGASWGDYDNDGDQDLFVANNVRATNHLYENQGDGTFSRKDNIGDLSEYQGYCHNAVWVDYDNDGYLDLFVSDYMPTRYNQIYHNDGNGTFSRATNNDIALEAKFSIGATWADYDNDGLQDLFVPNDRGDNNSLYHNEGNGSFTKITSGDIVNDGGKSTGSSWGDYDNDGDMDLFVANAGGENNFLYNNNGDGSFSKEYASIIVNDGGHSHGSVWLDINKDGYLDLFVGNNAGFKNFFYVNNGDGSFRKSELFDGDAENTMAVASADYDRDGDLDLFLANQGGQNNTLYTNDANPCISWKCIELQGVRSNRSAIGARIRLKAHINGNSIWQTREISTQSGGGASGQSSLKAYFGLGNAQNIDSIVIDWPSGFEQVLTNVQTDDCQTIVEADGAEICGVVFYDTNQNCVQDSGEAGIPNMLLEVLPGPKYVSTNDSGEYRIYRQYGTYTVSTTPNSDWSITQNCALAHTIVYESANRSGSLSFCGKDFAMQAACSKPDLLTYLSSTALRRGFVNTYAVSYLNRGAIAADSLELVVEFDNDIVVQSADVDWDEKHVYTDYTEYVWYVGKLESMDQQTIMIKDSVSVDAQIGKMAESRSYFRNPPDDCNLANNLTVDLNEIVGAVDPNDILVSPEGNILESDSLSYKIRFQNVGNYFATRVIIEDSIPEILDLSSLKILGASHDFDYGVSEDRVLRFTFNRIFLPDSNANEPASHGFVEFRIQPQTGLAVGSLIENKASIQFDYNAFIETNTVQNRITSLEELSRENLFELWLSPNPVETESLARLRYKENPELLIDTDRYELYDLEGRKLLEAKVGSQSFLLQKDKMGSGMYLLRAYDPFGRCYTRKLIIK